VAPNSRIGTYGIHQKADPTRAVWPRTVRNTGVVRPSRAWDDVCEIRKWGRRGPFHRVVESLRFACARVPAVYAALRRTADATLIKVSHAHWRVPNILFIRRIISPGRLWVKVGIVDDSIKDRLIILARNVAVNVLCGRGKAVSWHIYRGRYIALVAATRGADLSLARW
jgi:hypothetical protein